MPGALNGVRVLDFGQYIAGPLAAMLLADQGADVIRIDPPGGPRWSTPANQTWNRGKRSIVLDLKQAGDLQTARRLIERADVLVENFRPGVMNRLGLGAATMLAVNPRLIYCSLPGFASDDPRSSVPAWEGIVGAATRMYKDQLNEETDRPVYSAIPVSSCYAAFEGAVSIVMALVARARDGVGQQIEVPLFDATFAAIGWRASRTQGKFRQLANPPLVERWSREFECKDGRWISDVALNSRFRLFLEAVGAMPWANEDGSEGRIEELFRTRTSQEWEDFADRIGAEVAVCRTSAEWLENPHARASGIVIEVQDPRLGKLVQPGINVRLSRTPGEVRFPAPLPDSNHAEIVREASMPLPKTLPGTVDAGSLAALDGVRVLDLCTNLAGPTCGRTLAEFGADVIKIDKPGSASSSSNPDIGRGKRSLVLDLKSEDGLSVFWRLIEDADVVVQNFRKGVVERLGIGYEQVRARRPDIIYGSLNTYGQTGPWAGRPGHEPLAQAVTGMQERFGDGPPARHTYAIDDYASGINEALGIALALLHRRQTGEGQHVDTALAYTATILQSRFLQLYEGKRWDEPRGQDCLGSSALQRAYRASDRWLFLGARESDLERMDLVQGLSGVKGLTGLRLEMALEERIAACPAVEWEQRLGKAMIAAHRVVEDFTELIDDPWVCAHGLSITREHDGIGLITTLGPAPRLSRTPVVPGRPAPKPGADTVEILREIGLEGDLERLARNKVITFDGVSTP